MANTDRGNRPLSPHLEIYKFEWTMLLSSLHRITGIALALGALLVSWWLLAAASGPEYFAFADGLLTSWIGNLVLLGSVFALWFHTCNGVRHLAWDAGKLLDLPSAYRSGRIVVIAAGALTLLTVLFAL
jgi:succinate dehydrogenase / fumarate reductase cytochrome b subunit